MPVLLCAAIVNCIYCNAVFGSITEDPNLQVAAAVGENLAQMCFGPCLQHLSSAVAVQQLRSSGSSIAPPATAAAVSSVQQPAFKEGGSRFPAWKLQPCRVWEQARLRPTLHLLVGCVWQPLRRVHTFSKSGRGFLAAAQQQAYQQM